MSIDVVRFCERHGRVSGTFRMGDTVFCSRCLAEKLLELGVSEAKMKKFDREWTTGGFSTTCVNCGEPRPDTDEACPVCGYQS